MAPGRKIERKRDTEGRLWSASQGQSVWGETYKAEDKKDRAFEEPHSSLITDD